MKSPIILATLFAGSLAAGPLPGVDILPTLPFYCAFADTTISTLVAFFRPQLPDLPHMDDAVNAGVAAFKHKIKCGPAPPEPQVPPEQIDCRGQVDGVIDRGRAKLKLALSIIDPAELNEAVEEAIRVFRKTLGCKEKAEVVVRD